ncbi:MULTISPECIES: TetR/AcrR family transcriptional regulator [unclassified Streptomyces]|uniref:TetR/AcrR family transcriptional regulator n=1 Tax=unclassified Streptomyces TaxID=2593676 RepID=UPI002DDAF405|nr:MULTISPECIES: TetR/AcrR family transcriptional regulator [unclassified Streptomyces]WSA95525.1 TetR/AcrR family transcriptional regulator [Streptomyces sp. NBC_01795]WSB79939.1 TetR/AcrR family transcriptional regulator [Streptomyces sp. NBC_01775]WSS11853.1 TetR/AcrR family transcriptional regulator [Streptomyces sp. NBC_01186]WSS40568.1 TetR/AcrR family transcriptional regulator [Streptomyces sp. NBC_01187]
MWCVATTRRSRITPEREAELYETVLRLLREVGYDALTMDAVAASTHSSKATLYRQWGSKPELVARALKHGKPGPEPSGVDTGSLRGDLMGIIMSGFDDCRIEQDAALMRGVGRAAHDNPELLKALRELLIEPGLADLRVLLDRAVDRGEIRAGNPAMDLVPHMLLGALITGDLIEEKPVTQEFLVTYFDAVVLPALRA